MTKEEAWQIIKEVNALYPYNEYVSVGDNKDVIQLRAESLRKAWKVVGELE